MAIEERDERRRLTNLALFLTLLGTKVDSSSVWLRVEDPRHPGVVATCGGRVIAAKDTSVRLAGSEDWIDLRRVWSVEVEGGLRQAREEAEESRRRSLEIEAKSQATQARDVTE